MIRIIQLYLFVTIMIIAACSNQPVNHSWPKNVPSRTYFVEYYLQDKAHQSELALDKYLTWVKRFYLGWQLYRRGWLKATEELVITLETQKEQDEAKAKMFSAGRLIAAEWSKKRGHRVINTGHVAIWGNTLQGSIKRKEQIKVLNSILLDITGLLDKSITPKAITAERYYIPEPFEANIEF